MFKNILFFVVVFLGLFVIHADGPLNPRFSDEAVIRTLNNYVLDLNRLAEYALPSNCNSSGLDLVGLTSAANNIINNYFSTSIRDFVVIQSTSTAPNAGIVSNLTVGGDAVPAIGQPAFPDSQALFDYLKTYYVGFTGFFFSRPFYWLLSSPVVTQIKLRDPVFDGATTAYVTANNENKGFFCVGTTRGYRIQFSQYNHVFVYGEDTGAWKFIRFGERNNAMIHLNTSVITQVNP